MHEAFYIGVERDLSIDSYLRARFFLLFYFLNSTLNWHRLILQNMVHGYASIATMLRSMHIIHKWRNNLPNFNESSLPMRYVKNYLPCLYCNRSAISRLHLNDHQLLASCWPRNLSIDLKFWIRGSNFKFRWVAQEPVYHPSQLQVLLGNNKINKRWASEPAKEYSLAV